MNYLTEQEAQDMYDDFLDEIYEEANSPFNLSGSRALQETDPIAYRCGFSDYLDSLASDGYIIEDYNDEDTSECCVCNDRYLPEESDAENTSIYCSRYCERS